MENLVIWCYIVPTAFILGNLWFSAKSAASIKQLADAAGQTYHASRPEQVLKTLVLTFVPGVNLILLIGMLFGELTFKPKVGDSISV